MYVPQRADWLSSTWKSGVRPTTRVQSTHIWVLGGSQGNWPGGLEAYQGSRRVLGQEVAIKSRVFQLGGHEVTAADEDSRRQKHRGGEPSRKERKSGSEGWISCRSRHTNTEKPWMSYVSSLMPIGQCLSRHMHICAHMCNAHTHAHGWESSFDYFFSLTK